MTPSASTQSQCVSIRNRANAQHSTRPRSESGKQRSALNTLTHGLLPSQVVHELADTSWRLNRHSLLEALTPLGLPDDPAQDGFVFSKTEIEAFAQRTMRLNEAWKAENFTLHVDAL